MANVDTLSQGSLFAGKYLVDRLLKAGGMGAVYIVRHRETEARHALKVMHPEIVQNEEARRRFSQEARVASRIESTHVVTVIDAGVDDATGMPFLVMELLRGRELGDVLKERRQLSPQEVVTYLGQTARALDKAHAQGIIHRDLKPENLFLCESDEEEPKIKILDFGIAKILQGATQHTTNAGGTPLFMAPEQTSKNRQIGPPTDVWALGLIAYVLLVGRPYWEAETIYELFGEIMSPLREPPTRRAARSNASLPLAFDDWFARCVNGNPAERFPRAGEAIGALALVLGVTARSVDSRVPATAPTVFAPSTPAPTPPPAALVPRETPATPPPPYQPPVSAPVQRQGGATTSSPVSTTPPQPGASPGVLPTQSSSKPRGRGPLTWMVGGVALVTLTLGVGVLLKRRAGGHGLATGTARKSAAAASSVAPEPHPSVPAKEGAGEELREGIEAVNAFVLARSPLLLQRHEVTRSEFALFVSSLPEPERPKMRPLRDWSGEPVEPASAKHPVTWVTHAQAKKFCEAIKARLPSSEEWAHAAGKHFPWGDAWPPPQATQIALGRPNGGVTNVESSPLDKLDTDVFDMIGNVKEWTSSVSEGFAVIRGADVSTPMHDAKAALTMTSQKEDGEGSESSPAELSGPRLGFRCARSSP